MPPKILIIDDDETIRLLFKQVFVDAGYEVELAANGREALEVLNSLTPDIMFLDIEMPVLSGPEFAEQFRRLVMRRPELAAITYIVMTGKDYNDEVADLGFKKDKHFIKYFPKTSPIEELLSLVDSTLQGKRK